MLLACAECTLNSHNNVATVTIDACFTFNSLPS